MKKIAAFFDFDDTLIKGNSLPKFLWFYANPLSFIKKSLCLAPVLLKYILGMTDGDVAKERIFIYFFAGIKREEFMEKARSFSLSVIPALVNDEAMQRLKWHQNQGHECILVSASIEEYLKPWAESMGFTKVMSTRLEIDNKGCITGKFLGRNCKGYEKIRRIEEYMGSLKQYETYAYGDSRGDKELLDNADHPFYKSFNRGMSYKNE